MAVLSSKANLEVTCVMLVSASVLSRRAIHVQTARWNASIKRLKLTFESLPSKLLVGSGGSSCPTLPEGYAFCLYGHQDMHLMC